MRMSTALPSGAEVPALRDCETTVPGVARSWRRRAAHHEPGRPEDSLRLPLSLADKVGNLGRHGNGDRHIDSRIERRGSFSLAAGCWAMVNRDRGRILYVALGADGQAPAARTGGRPPSARAPRWHAVRRPPRPGCSSKVRCGNLGRGRLTARSPPRPNRHPGGRRRRLADDRAPAIRLLLRRERRVVQAQPHGLELQAGLRSLRPARSGTSDGERCGDSRGDSKSARQLFAGSRALAHDGAAWTFGLDARDIALREVRLCEEPRHFFAGDTHEERNHDLPRHANRELHGDTRHRQLAGGGVCLTMRPVSAGASRSSSSIAPTVRPAAAIFVRAADSVSAASTGTSMDGVSPRSRRLLASQPARVQRLVDDRVHAVIDEQAAARCVGGRAPNRPNSRSWSGASMVSSVVRNTSAR